MAPPSRDKPSALITAADNRGVEAAMANTPADSKAVALRSYRRAMGQCYKCGEKWSRDHKCSPTVQLHVVQELWDALQLDDDGEISPSSVGSSGQLFMAISKAAIEGFPAPRTVKFTDSIQHKPVTLLIDSGSSVSFISSYIANQLAGAVSLARPINVQVAGGGLLSCAVVIPQALWFIGDISFQTDLRILPLSAYVIIIGMDWLEMHSPMKVHWRNKWLEIPYGNQTIKLQGVVPDQPEEILV
jgi:hypothetical protein